MFCMIVSLNLKVLSILSPSFLGLSAFGIFIRARVSLIDLITRSMIAKLKCCFSLNTFRLPPYSNIASMTSLFENAPSPSQYMTCGLNFSMKSTSDGTMSSDFLDITGGDMYRYLVFMLIAIRKYCCLDSTGLR